MLARDPAPPARLARRRILAALGFTLADACVPRAQESPLPTGPRLSRVKVSVDRVTRTVCGLRPFRPSGFVVRAERLGDKTVVHNYGHGGGGISLSWGTSDLAVEVAMSTGARRVAVLGCGAVGLATARLLQQRGVEVTIHAAALPPDTTSNVAGGQWFPFSVFDRGKETPAFLERFARAARFSHRRFQTMLGDEYGVRWIPNYMMSAQPFRPGGLLGSESPIRELIPELRELAPDEHPFPFAHVRRFDTMLIEPHVYLEAVLRDFRLAGGRVVVQSFQAIEQVLALPEATLLDCTGLGAKALFSDPELVPVKGQLTFLLPQPEVDYIALSDELYMFPRRDGILLGGTWERGVSTLEPDPTARERILGAHAALFGEMR